LVASFDHALYVRIEQMTQTSAASPQEAVMLLLGCSFERFGEMALQGWKIPDAIIQSIAVLPGSELKKSSHRSDWLKQVASFSDALAAVIMSGRSDAAEQYEQILKRYGKVLELDQNTLDSMLERVEAETRLLAKSMDIAIPKSVSEVLESNAPDALPSEFLLKAPDLLRTWSEEHYPSGKPWNARDLLLAGVQDVTQMLASDPLKLNDLILLVLETLYTSMGFRFATVCLRDLASGQYLSRVAVGENYAERQKKFHFPMKADAGLFHLAMSNNVDVMISDTAVAKIRRLLPQWHTDLLPDARSFIVLPLVIQKKPLGLFYADRSVTAEEGVPADEAALIKTLKSQLLAAMMRI